MSPEIDRIPVPTDGRQPDHDADDAAPSADAPATNPAADQATVAFTPTQLAVGFGILASLVVLAVGRLRRRDRSGRGGW